MKYIISFECDEKVKVNYGLFFDRKVFTVHNGDLTKDADIKNIKVKRIEEEKECKKEKDIDIKNLEVQEGIENMLLKLKEPIERLKKMIENSLDSSDEKDNEAKKEESTRLDWMDERIERLENLYEGTLKNLEKKITELEKRLSGIPYIPITIPLHNHPTTINPPFTITC